MIAEATDFASECEATYALIRLLDDADHGRETQFKSRTVSDVMQHLYLGDIRTHMTLTNTEGYARIRAERQAIVTASTAGKLANQGEAAGNLEGHAMLAAWCASAAYAQADPKPRVQWTGRDMSARSSITARLVETWSHSQALYDVLGQDRVGGDCIRSVAHMGAITHGWTFANRGEDSPGPPPLIRLTGSSGTAWEWNAKTAPANAVVVGSATDFCQGVTQTRNFADVDLSATGKAATTWMNQAQCCLPGVTALLKMDVLSLCRRLPLVAFDTAVVPVAIVRLEQHARTHLERGDDGAQLSLGAMHERGEGVPQDHALAYACYNPAAAQWGGGGIGPVTVVPPAAFIRALPLS